MRTSPASLLLLLLPLLSCGGPMPPGEGAAAGGALTEKQGSRLRRQAWYTSDGAVIGTGIFRDADTGELCTFGLAGDGWACVPLQLGKAQPARPGLVTATLDDWR